MFAAMGVNMETAHFFKQVGFPWLQLFMMSSQQLCSHHHFSAPCSCASPRRTGYVLWLRCSQPQCNAQGLVSGCARGFP